MNNLKIDVTVRDDGYYQVEAKDLEGTPIAYRCGPSLEHEAQHVVNFLESQQLLEEGYSLVIIDVFGVELTISPQYQQQDFQLRPRQMQPNLDIPEDVEQR